MGRYVLSLRTRLWIFLVEGAIHQVSPPTVGSGLRWAPLIVVTQIRPFNWFDPCDVETKSIPMLPGGVFNYRWDIAVKSCYKVLKKQTKPRYYRLDLWFTSPKIILGSNSVDFLP